jgi:hypothetical protein
MLIQRGAAHSPATPQPPQELAVLSRELLAAPIAGQQTAGGARPPGRGGSASPYDRYEATRAEAARAEAALSALMGPVQGVDDDGATIHRRYACGSERPVSARRRLPPFHLQQLPLVARGSWPTGCRACHVRVAGRSRVPTMCPLLR